MQMCSHEHTSPHPTHTESRMHANPIIPAILEDKTPREENDPVEILLGNSFSSSLKQFSIDSPPAPHDKLTRLIQFLSFCWNTYRLSLPHPRSSADPLFVSDVP